MALYYESQCDVSKKISAANEDVRGLVSVASDSESNLATSSSANSYPNDILKSCPTSATIKITDDLTITLVPCVKLNYSLCCENDVFYMYVSEPIVKDLVTLKFESPRVFKKPIRVPYKDVGVHMFHPPKIADDKYLILAEGSLTFRDPSADSMELLVEFQNKLLQKVGGANVVGFCGEDYQVRVSAPEDPTHMMASASELTQDPPTIMLTGFPIPWFTEEATSKPSQRLLLIFFSNFGKVRALDIVEFDEFGKATRNGDATSNTLHCKVLVQYENFGDCKVALKFLCAHSLQKETGNIADYEVSLKELEDRRPCTCLDEESIQCRYCI